MLWNTNFKFLKEIMSKLSLSRNNDSSQVLVGSFTYGHEDINWHTWNLDTKCHIGKYCCISSGVNIILGGNHRPDWISMYPFGSVNQEIFGFYPLDGHPASKGDIIIKNDIWIGINATILSGVTIGNGAVIAAGSVISKDVAPYSIVAGNPAKEIKKRFTPDIIELLERLAYWDLPVEIVANIKKDLCKVPTIESLEILLKRLKK